MQPVSPVSSPSLRFQGSLYKVNLANTSFANCATLFDVESVDNQFLDKMTDKVILRDQRENRADPDSDYTVYALHRGILYLLTGQVGCDFTQFFQQQTPQLKWPDFIAKHIETFAQSKHQGGISEDIGSGN